MTQVGRECDMWEKVLRTVNEGLPRQHGRNGKGMGMGRCALGLRDSGWELAVGSLACSCRGGGLDAEMLHKGNDKNRKKRKEKKMDDVMIYKCIHYSTRMT